MYVIYVYYTFMIKIYIFNIYFVMATLIENIIINSSCNLIHTYNTEY